MNWQTIREKYPGCWLIVEATDAHTEGTNRIIDDLEVAAVFGNEWQPAWEHYKTLHHDNKNREYYVLHTDRESLDIGILDSFGRTIAE